MEEISDTPIEQSNNPHVEEHDVDHKKEEWPLWPADLEKSGSQ